MSAPTTEQVLIGLANTASLRQMYLAELDAGYRRMAHTALPLIVAEAGCPGCEYDGHQDDFAPAHTCGQGGAR